MPNAVSSHPVTRPVRPNRTTSASAITNGGVMIGRIDITFSRPANRCPPRCTTSASTRPRSVDSTPTMVASSAEFTATPQRVPPRRQSSDQMSAVRSLCAASAGAKFPFASRTADSSDLPTGKKMNSSNSAAITTTIVATAGSPREHAPPRDRPREADRQRAQCQRGADAERGTAIAGGKPGPDSPRDRQCGRARRESVAAPGREQQRGQGRGEQRPEQRLTGNAPQQRRRSADARPRHDGECHERNGRDDRRRAIACHRHEDGSRERGRGGRHWQARRVSARTAARRALRAPSGGSEHSERGGRSFYLGNVETSLSHLVSRRERSADEPYLTKS